MTRLRRSIQSGFTLMELLVAVALTLIMLVAINRIFSDTQKAIGGGVGLSRVIADSRVMVSQIRRDADMMIGPQRKTRKPMHGQWIEPMHGGILIIVQREIEAPVPAVGGQGLVMRKVRSDQLAFIRARGDEDPLTPSGENNYTSLHLPDADFLRVWYGHVRRTSPLGDGNDTADRPDDPDRAGALGRQPEVVTGPDDQSYTIDNELASQWILGRQALFLQTRFDEQASPNFPPVFMEGGDPHDDNAVRGLPNSVPVPEALYMGLTDIAAYGFDRECLGYNLTPYYGAIVGGFPSGSAPLPPEPTQRLWNNFPNHQSFGGANNFSYIHRAVFYNTFARKRLRVNTQPVFNFDADFDMPSWQVAQMHPYFVGGVSDFIVEFAGDYMSQPDNNTSLPGPDGKVDTVRPNPLYVASSPDTDYNGRNYMHAGGEVRWYDGYAEFHAEDPRHEENDPWKPTLYNSQWPARYEFPDDPDDPNIPYTINPLWRDINNSTSNTSALPHADHVFVFRHDDDGRRFNLPDGTPGSTPFNTPDGTPGSMWPDMIRLRWRMHDPQNQLFDAKTNESGKWFEMIIPIPRPPRPS